MDLRTRYTALVTLTTQHVKYISDALRRLEEEEVGLHYKSLSCLQLEFVVRLPKQGKEFHIYLVKHFVVSVQKEVEEEKQARVGQVSDLLGWVKGLQGRTGGPNAESSLAAQQVQQKSNIYTLFYRQVAFEHFTSK